MGTVNQLITIATVLAAAGWIGEVITLNFIVVPSLRMKDLDQQGQFIGVYFPRFFRMATVFALATVAGLAFSLATNGIVDQPTLVPAGILIGALTLFHLGVESRLRPIALSLRLSPDEGKTRLMVRFLRVVPRIGIVVLTAGFVLIILSIL